MLTQRQNTRADIPVSLGYCVLNSHNYLSFLPMEGYFFFTAALTLVFSAGVPDCPTRDRAFLACASFSIGYFLLSGSAKDFVGSAFRAALESFAISHLTETRTTPRGHYGIL